MVIDKQSGTATRETVTLTSDEGNRPDTTAEGLAKLKSVRDGGVITAGNASQLSDGASACVLMEAEAAEKRGLQPLGRYVGMAVAGTKPDEMGIGPIYAVPKLLQRFGLRRIRWRRQRPRGVLMSPRCGDTTARFPQPSATAFLSWPPRASVGRGRANGSSISSGALPRPSRNGRGLPAMTR